MNGCIGKVTAVFFIGFSYTAGFRSVPAVEPPDHPPRRKPAIGQEEWNRTGEYPKTLVLPISNGNDSTPRSRMLFSSPIDAKHVAPPHDVTFGLNRPLPKSGKTDGWQERSPVLRIVDSPRMPLDSSLHVGHSGAPYELVEGDVFPFHDQLVLVKTIALENVTLELVKDRIPKALWPANVSRCLTLNLHERRAPFFLHEGSNQWFFGQIRVDKIDPKKRQADLTLSPPDGAKGVPTTTLTLAKDDLLRARHGIAYRVLNVVPPQDIKDVGRLVGWIEIAPHPEKAAKADP